MGDSGGVVRSLTVLGDAPGGVAVRRAASVLINNAVIQPRSSTGEASAVAPGIGSVTRVWTTATGVASSGTVGGGVAVLQERTAFAGGPNLVDCVLETRTATGTALNGSISVGLARRLPIDVDGLALSQGLGVGRVTLQSRLSAGVAKNGGDAQGAITVLRRTAAAVAFGGSVASAAVILQKRTAGGINNVQALASAAIIRRLAVTNGYGEETLASTFRTWALNLENEALSEYTNHAFNSYANFNGETYAAGPNGVYLVNGKTDAGVTIPWVVRTGLHDDKNAQQKRLHEIVLAVRHDGPVRVRVWVDELTYYDYTLANYKTMLQQTRVKIGRGLRSRYYRVELTGMEGTNFELDTMNIPMEPVKRRIG